MNNNLFKKTEKILYDFKNMDLKIQNIDLHINRLINDVSCAGVSYEERTGPTNAFSSSVENEVIRREEHMSQENKQLKQIKNDTITIQQIVKNALNTLNEEEYKLVELRYFQKNKKTWIEIGMTLGIDKDNCCKMKNKIINKLTNYIYPSTPAFDQFFTSF